MVWDVARRYIRYLVIFVFFIFLLLGIIGIPAKVYELSGLREWIRKRSNSVSETSNDFEDHGSARRLVSAGLEDKEPPSKEIRRVISQDSDGSISRIVRSKSDMNRTDFNRPRTLSEGNRNDNKNVVVPEIIRQSSNPVKSTKARLADFQKTLSENSAETVSTQHSIADEVAVLRNEASIRPIPNQSVSEPVLSPTKIPSGILRDDGENLYLLIRFRRIFIVVIISLFVLTIFMFGIGISCTEYRGMGDSFCHPFFLYTSLVDLKSLQAKLIDISIFLFPSTPEFLANENDGSLSSIFFKIPPFQFGIILTILFSCLILNRPPGYQQQLETDDDSDGTSEKAESNFSQDKPLENGARIINNVLEKFLRKTKKAEIEVFRCDPNGIELPSIKLNFNAIDQSAVFCLLLTLDPFERATCFQEISHFISHKAVNSTFVILLTGEDAIEATPLDFQKLLGSLKNAIKVVWPSSKQLGHKEKRKQAIFLLKELVEKERRHNPRYLWDIFVSHFLGSKSTPHLLMLTPSTTMMEVLAYLVSKVADLESIQGLTNLIIAQIHCKTLQEAEGMALLAVLRAKEKIPASSMMTDDRLSQPSSVVGSVLEVPISPTFYPNNESSQEDDDADDDTSHDGLSSSNKYENVTTEHARKMNLQFN